MLRIRFSLVAVAALLAAAPSAASTPPFRQQASHLCATVLDSIKQPPSGKPFSALTRSEADAFLGSASVAFGTLAEKLGRLQPPRADKDAYSKMLSGFRATSHAFAQSKASFDQGDRPTAMRQATAAAKKAGDAAAIGQSLKLGQCGR